MASTGGGGLSADDDVLPPLVRLDAGGDWADYLELIYAHFERDFLGDDVATFEGLRVGIAEPVLEDGKSGTFWHIITKEQSAGSRTADMPRCERIRWVRRLIDLAALGGGEVVWWRKQHGRDRRIEMALPDFSYLIVMSERHDRVLLITAYPVEFGHERRRLKRRWVKFGES